MGDPYDAILLIDKSEGETSFDAVRKVRRILKAKKAGHAGTLDPFATGLLILLLGQGTKLSSYLMSAEKDYRATMRLGIETDTQDLTGSVTERRPVTRLDAETIRAAAVGFVGEIEQVPPIYSAVKLKGKRAYEFARKGISVELKKRRVKILSLEIVSVELPDVTMDVTCSSGTYIRSLAADLGTKLGTGAHLRALRRLRSGPFSVNEAIDLKHIGSKGSEDILLRRLIPLRGALPHLKEVAVDDLTAKNVRNGHQPQGVISQIEQVGPRGGDEHIKLVNQNCLVAIVQVRQSLDPDKRTMKLLRVFH